MFRCGGCERRVPGNRPCLYCGGTPEPVADEEVLFCCRCGGPMDKAVTQAIVVDRCPNCGGTWYDKGELEATIEKKAMPDDGAQSRAQVAAYALDAKDTRVQYLKCPRCTRIMTRVNYGRVSGVILDTCGYHGGFVDGGENEKIRAFVQTGGLGVKTDRAEHDAADAAGRDKFKHVWGSVWADMVWDITE